MNKLPELLLGIFIVVGLTSCEQPVMRKDFYQFPATEGSILNIVVESPAGTNKQIVYWSNTRRFEGARYKDDVEKIGFLPYPVNFGFIPSTTTDETRQSRSKALDALLICESKKTATMVKSVPIATLIFREEGVEKNLVVAVPWAKEQRVIDAVDFQTFLIDYDAAKRSIELWLLNYQGIGAVDRIRWENEHYTWSLIHEHEISQ